MFYHLATYTSLEFIVSLKIGSVVNLLAFMLNFDGSYSFKRSFINLDLRVFNFYTFALRILIIQYKMLIMKDDINEYIYRILAFVAKIFNDINVIVTENCK